MLKIVRFCSRKKNFIPLSVQVKQYITNEYRCTDSWNSYRSSPLLEKVNLNDFYPAIDQNYTQKGVISAIDVDLFANAINDQHYLDELRDLLYKLRLSADTGVTLESTHHATVRNYVHFNRIDELLEMLNDPLNYGIFLDDYSANILLDNLLVSNDFEKAAFVASLYMKQEEYSNKITCSMCQYACYKHISGFKYPEQEVKEEVKSKVEEVKIRIRYLRNPYFDDHFDLKDPLLLSGKTLAWLSEQNADNLNLNLQVVGWLFYKKPGKLIKLCETLSKLDIFKVYPEVLELMKKESETNSDMKDTIESCLLLIGNKENTQNSLEDALKDSIENAINKYQKDDVSKQQQLFNLWSEIREQKLTEQAQRLDRAKRIELIQEKQNQLSEEEQKLWFFENEEKIDLELEEKEQNTGKPNIVKNISKQIDDDYIPPEILRRRK